MLEFEFHLGPLHLVFRLGEYVEAETEERRDVDMPAAQVERAPESWDVEDRRTGFRPNGSYSYRRGVAQASGVSAAVMDASECD